MYVRGESLLYIHTYRQVNQESRTERLVTLLQRSFKAVVRCMYVCMHVQLIMILYVAGEWRLRIYPGGQTAAGELILHERCWRTKWNFQFMGRMYVSYLHMLSKVSEMNEVYVHMLWRSCWIWLCKTAPVAMTWRGLIPFDPLSATAWSWPACEDIYRYLYESDVCMYMYLLQEEYKNLYVCMHTCEIT